VKFFFPDSQDLVDPSFDFVTEARSTTRIRQRDDLYAHEVFSSPAYDGLLVSKGIVDGFGETGSRYSQAQRHRLLRSGSAEFFRTQVAVGGRLPIMGDCGAFTYVREDRPPYSVDEVLQFYEACGFDFGISVDHVILAYRPEWDAPKAPAPAELIAARARQAVTLELAAQFLKQHRTSHLRFEPMGVAQGWSPKSYALAVKALQKMGYRYIAVGGMVPLKTPEIMATLEEVAAVRKADVRFHLLGVTRIDNVGEYVSFGVASLDSTSPLRQAFKDDRDNYYTVERTYTAVRVPQVDANPKLLRSIRAGKVSFEVARELEQSCLRLLAAYDAGQGSLDTVIEQLRRYEEVYDPLHDHSEVYREVLTDQPWKTCGCDVCRQLGHHVILFRGAERNRRRGFHNLWVFYRRLQGTGPAPRKGLRPRRRTAQTTIPFPTT
jgi:hypothetical protein